MKINTGCSGFYNRRWKGVFYPENLAQSKWFTFYCSHFKTLEINVTFYKFPTVKMLDAWYKKSPADFLFAVKAPRLITHYKKLKDCSEQLSDFYQACKLGLKNKMGCALFQFPPSFKYDEETLDLILKSMNAKFKNVVEFRHVSWWKEEVYTKLKNNNIIFCSVSHPQLPEDIIVNSETVYMRLHGNPKQFHSSYPAQYLLNLQDNLIQNKNIKEAYIFFNNTASTAGIVNAQQFNLNIQKHALI